MSESKSQVLKLPKVSNQKENYGIYQFRIVDCDVSIINALRRTLITDIPVVCFNVEEYNDVNESLKSVQFYTNTTSFNNEILKQRLSCIPIHITDEMDPESIDSLMIEVNENNTTDSIKYVTTEHFKIIDTTSNKELSKTQRDKIFPKSSLTNDYILFARLKPSVSKTIPSQSLHFRSKLFISTAKHNGQFNCCSTAAYAYTEDTREQQNRWLSKENELSSLNYDDNKIAEMKQDWFLHEAKRITIKDSFDFNLESVGVYRNEDLIRKACEILAVRFGEFKNNITDSFEYLNDTTNVENSYDVKMYNYDYTVGKVIEYMLNTLFFKNEKVLSYVGFIKKHPHDDFSIIRIVFKDSETSNIENFQTLLTTCADKAVEIFANIRLSFV